MRRFFSLAFVLLFAVPAFAQEPPKQWVWLSKQGVYGYGYQRPDGLWVVDPGSKRQPAQQEASGDPYGFAGWLNGVRASAGLGPVGVDANLSAQAQQNNAIQQSRGLGHYYMGSARRQNAAMGHYSQIGAMWLSSPAHRAALLDPSITTIGIAGLGMWWTFDAR